MPPSEESATGATGARRVIGAIPARYGSQRFPGKVLAPLAGRPMIEHVYRRAAAAENLESVVVLTDDERVRDAVVAFGGACEMTPADCASGTDRIAWAARGWSHNAVVNIQGDEPLIDPQAIDAVAAHLIAEPADPIVTLAADAAPEDADDPNVVKVVTDRRGYALYFSRAPIPYRRGDAASPRAHIGIYGYQTAALLELAGLAPSPLERTESLEQLRALENGLPIRVLAISAAWRGVDTISDLEKTEARLRAEAAGAAGRENR